MKLNLIAIILITFSCNLNAQNIDSWKPVKREISTTWADKIDVKNVLPEYPRPQFERTDNWKNLNGLWDYAIAEKSLKPTINQGKILVPFAVESALSGVGKTVGKDSLIWYKTSFIVPKNFKGKQTLLHFGAVDWRTEIYLNGNKVGMHEGGYDPFTFNITPYLKHKGNQELTVKVWDPTELGPQPNGKQNKRPHGIWYTSVTGIWQTVWIEAVNKNYLESINITPNIDEGTLSISPKIISINNNQLLKITAWDGNIKVAESIIKESEVAELKILNPKLWSPESPFLYDLKLELIENGKIIDKVNSYFAMRKISVGKDKNGIKRMLLNNKFVFQYGTLDQGWWPGGLYTAPSDEALKSDIDKTKQLGFNLIRKHVKVESARWYYHCDKEGMLVWQDMPSGDLGGNEWEPSPGTIDKIREKQRTPESEAIYKKEWNAIMETLHNYPCIIVWVPFNEGWGQFKTEEIANLTREKDPSRLISPASGGNFFPIPDILDIHHYPNPVMPDPAFVGKDYVLACGEFGGLGLPVNGHMWQQKHNWGYQSFKNEDELLTRYKDLMVRLNKLINLGLSVAIYTQITDVEIESNGLMTYDRKVVKLNEGEVYKVNQELYKTASNIVILHK